MPTDEEIHNALTAIYSRLGTIEGRITLIARADRGPLLELLKGVVRKSPLVGQIYLVLDGKRNQTQIVEELAKAGVETSPMSVSRAIVKMHTEHGIAELVKGGRTNVFLEGDRGGDRIEPLEERPGLAGGRRPPRDGAPGRSPEEGRMNGASPAELQRLIGSEFEDRGWEYDLSVGRSIVEEIVASGRVDAQRLAQRVSSTYLQRIGAARTDMAEAIESAVGGRVPRSEEQASATLILNDNRYQLNMGPGGQIMNSQVNIGGMQINVRAESPKEEVMAGVAALVRAGLAGDWNGDAARELGGVIDTRDDIALTDIEGAVAEVVAVEAPGPGRARQMLESISTQGLGGALGTGISAVIGALIRNPPI